MIAFHYVLTFANAHISSKFASFIWEYGKQLNSMESQASHLTINNYFQLFAQSVKFIVDNSFSKSNQLGMQ